MRSEHDIFSEMATLSKSPGYIHAIAFLCFRDNVITYSSDGIVPEDFEQQFAKEHLVRSELSTLIGLMIQTESNIQMPSPQTLQNYLDKTEELLGELHDVLKEPMFNGLLKKINEPLFNSLSGDVLREAIFYGAESAYNFQYRDFAIKKYATDNTWLKSNTGFEIQEVRNVVLALSKLQSKKVEETIEKMRTEHPDNWTFLPAFTFDIAEVTEVSGVSSSSVEAMLKHFSAAEDDRNQFKALNDYNVANAKPIIPLGNKQYALFHNYSFAEAVYDSPFYWMLADKGYKDTAMTNRGFFTERFCEERLKCVFGENNVFSNVDIRDSKGETLGEIDVLVFYENRAIVLQAKSKRLTLEARKGNDNKIKDDFKKSVQDSYDQGLLCAKMLRNGDIKLFINKSIELSLPTEMKEFFILCVVSDHYPSLSFQVREFLKFEQNQFILPPFVLDIFTLDAISEMLDTPLHFLSYIRRRANYFEKLLVSHELIILSYHLKKNLWIESEHDLLSLSDDISSDLDIAMMVRREGATGKRTPDGILTRLRFNTLGEIINDMGKRSFPNYLDLGFFLLSLSEDTFNELSGGIDKITGFTHADQKNHDFSSGFNTTQTGITIHSNIDSEDVAIPRLHNHCELRKYKEKASHWFGILVDPHTKLLKRIIYLNYNWQLDVKLEILSRKLGSTGASTSIPTVRSKIGRNDSCPCGSGLKYKKCCLIK